MSLSKNKREEIRVYICERLAREGSDGLVESVSQTFDLTGSSVYRLIREMIADGILLRDGRRLTFQEDTHSWTFQRSDVWFEQDNIFYSSCILPLIRDLPENVRQIWDYGFTEIMNNAIDHSRTERLDVTYKRNFHSTSIAIRDYGDGIFRHIQSACGFPTLEDALAELYKGKLTTDETRHSGEGIFFTSRGMDLFVAAANGLEFSHNKFDEMKIQALTGQLMDVDSAGTLVYMSLSNTSKKSMKEIFDRYTNENFEFTKTSIPIANIYGFPVSRSQANRLLNRIEDFEEVVLDFTGIEAVGQGFADQIFRIYKRDHPDIKIVTVGTNETVDNMIRHVTKNSFVN